MKRYFLSAAFLAGALSPVVAADLAPVESPPAISAPAAFDWNGFYLGGNVGGGRADVDWTYQPFGETAHHDGKGFLGGVQAGYNWQIDGFVIGAEADFLGPASMETRPALIRLTHARAIRNGCPPSAPAQATASITCLSTRLADWE